MVGEEVARESDVDRRGTLEACVWAVEPWKHNLDLYWVDIGHLKWWQRRVHWVRYGLRQRHMPVITGMLTAS